MAPTYRRMAPSWKRTHSPRYDTPQTIGARPAATDAQRREQTVEIGAGRHVVDDAGPKPGPPAQPRGRHPRLAGHLEPALQRVLMRVERRRRPRHRPEGGGSRRSTARARRARPRSPELAAQQGVQPRPQDRWCARPGDRVRPYRGASTTSRASAPGTAAFPRPRTPSSSAPRPAGGSSGSTRGGARTSGAGRRAGGRRGRRCRTPGRTTCADRPSPSRRGRARAPGRRRGRTSSAAPPYAASTCSHNASRSATSASSRHLVDRAGVGGAADRADARAVRDHSPGRPRSPRRPASRRAGTARRSARRATCPTESRGCRAPGGSRSAPGRSSRPGPLRAGRRAAARAAPSFAVRATSRMTVSAIRLAITPPEVSTPQPSGPDPDEVAQPGRHLLLDEGADRAGVEDVDALVQPRRERVAGGRHRQRRRREIAERPRVRERCSRKGPSAPAPRAGRPRMSPGQSGAGPGKPDSPKYARRSSG